MIFSIADILINLNSEINIELLNGVRMFLVDKEKFQYNIDIIFSNERKAHYGALCGEDSFFLYYYDGTFYYQKAKEGTDGSISLAIYTSDFQQCQLYINEKAFPGIVRSVNKVFQLLPMKQLLTYNNVLMLHSSRIIFGNIAILFTAPSQVGKTTQAKLWCQYENAKMVSNDRSLLRRKENEFFTYGYLVDGSSPIYSNREISLGSIVVLRQSNMNQVRRLPIRESFIYLMEQTVFNIWNNEERNKITQLWLDLLEKYPVYLLECKPDIGAVQCLKRQLLKDGVINDDINS